MAVLFYNMILSICEYISAIDVVGLPDMGWVLLVNR